MAKQGCNIHVVVAEAHPKNCYPKQYVRGCAVTCTYICVSSSNFYTRTHSRRCSTFFSLRRIRLHYHPTRTQTYQGVGDHVWGRPNTTHTYASLCSVSNTLCISKRDRPRENHFLPAALICSCSTQRTLESTRARAHSTSIAPFVDVMSSSLYMPKLQASPCLVRTHEFSLLQIAFRLNSLNYFC